jgi:TRAP-type C4-dicarboxylate transport system substrate-binding protein
MLLCATEVASVEDLQGLRVRGSTGMMNSAIRLMGANGVNVAFGEIPQAFERGNIDCMIGNESWMTIFGLTEIVKTSVPQPTLGMVPASTFVSFSADAWADMSDAAKAALVDYMPRYAADVTMSYLEADRAARDAALAEGMQEVDLGDRFAAMRDELTAVERERILSEARERGVADPEALLAAYEANYAEWMALSPGIGTDAAAFAEALRERVYADFPM